MGLVFLFMICAGVATAFGKSMGFAVGLFFLGVAFWPILGFGDARYVGAGVPARGFAPVMPGSPQA